MFNSTVSKYDYNNIIFVETFKKSFDIKQLCAIESAAKHNPNAKIIVKSLSAKLDVEDFTGTYSNIESSIIDLNETFKNTPFNEFWRI